MESSPDAVKAKRIAVFLERLRVARPAASHDEAFQLVADVLNGVEDEMTSIPFDPDYPDDGRMYPARLDSMRVAPDRPDVKRYRHKGHSTLVGDNGAIDIKDHRTGSIIFSKPGSDGRTIADGGRP
jgi:hypothetical protein